MVTTIDTPYLPPPPPLSPTMSVSPHGQREGCPPQQTRSPHLSVTPRHSSPSRRGYSPSKTRLSPAKLSPRKSSPVKGLFNTSPRPVSVSFTPQRTRQPPRAWQRRPATPYVPRDDKHKIYKRLPLAELGVDINQPAGVSRKEKEGRKDYERIVKRLKIAHTQDKSANHEDKENYTPATDDRTEEWKTIKTYPSAFCFVNMRVEDDRIHGSPKKKLRNLNGSYSPDLIIDENEALEDTDATEDEEDDDQEAFEEAHLPDTLHEHHEQADFADKMSGANKDSSFETDLACEGAAQESFRHESDELAHSEKSEADTVGNAQENVDDENRGSQQKDSASGVELSVGADAGDSTTKHSPQPATAIIPNSGALLPMDVDETSFLQSFIQKTKAQRQAKQIEAANNSSIALVPIELSADEEEMEQDVLEDPNDPIQDSPAQSDQRTEYERQLDAEIMQEAQTSPLRRSKRTATPTALPRLAGLPNTIQLKRANGNEFVFRAGQAVKAGADPRQMTDPAHVGIMTRANTKRNKGAALNVRIRLEQLKNEHVEQTKEQEDEQRALVDEHNIVDDEAHQQEKLSKNKRKNKALDNRPKKVLRWNDSNLVQTTEVPAREIPSSDDDAEINVDTEASTDNAGRTPAKIQLKLRTSAVAGAADDEATKVEGTPTEAQKDQLDGATASQTRVKRRNRPATPITKRAASRINETPEQLASLEGQVDENREMTDDAPPTPESAAVTAALAEVKESQTLADQETARTARKQAPVRKSRMPVPTKRATPIGQSAARVARASATNTRSQDQGGKTDEQKAREIKAKEREKDLAGPRRLRVRS